MPGRRNSGGTLQCLASFFLLAPLIAGCKNDAKDAHCTPDEPDHATDPSCIYAGTGKGPLFQDDPPCPPVTGVVPADCPNFYDVVNVLGERGLCSTSGCHGTEDTAQTDIYLPIGDPFMFYAALLDAEGTVGTPYVIADDPDTADNEATGSWIICNLQGAHGGGYPMPPPGGMPDPADIDLVTDWILCGAPAPVPCAETAGDSECVTCAKSFCCPQIQQCIDDAGCLGCAACIQINGDPTQCTAECDMTNALVGSLFSCAGVHCEAECPGTG